MADTVPRRCIYRYIYNDGTRCAADQISEDCKYCKKHKNKNNYIFDIMEAALSKDNVNDERDLYKIFQYIYDNELDPTTDKKKVFFAIVAYLLSRATLLSVLYKTIYLNGQNNMQIDIFQKKTKRNVITFVYDILMDTYNLSKSEDNIYKITKIQRFLRRHLYRKITEHNKSVSENLEDPFTYDSIDEIPSDHKFSYKDCNGHIYIFNAVEFEYYLRLSGSLNPYTKEELPAYIVKRLYMLMKYNKLQQKQEDEFKWQTTLHAYTDLSLSMERAGFYTSVEWFEKITYGVCKNIITSFKRSNNTNSCPYFTSEINRITYVFDFCKEAINLFKEADEHYLLCCNFMKALAANVKEFRNNLPSWLRDDISTRVFGGSPNDTLLFMYVQDLLDNMDELDIISRRQLHLRNGNISRIVFER